MKSLYHHIVSACLLAAAPAFAGTNLLRNSGFETGGSTTLQAQQWEYGNPNNDGGNWGNAARRDWRSHSGTWEGTLQGTWYNGDDFGGWWQQADALPGVLYEASAWFWADTGTFSGAPWTNLAQQLMIEFYSTNFTYLGVFVTNFTGQVGESWTQKSVRAIAPSGTAKARFVVSVIGAGSAGALQFDDAELRTVTTREQTFNDWDGHTNLGTHVRDDWIVSTGKIVSTALSGTNVLFLSHSGLAASLNPPTAGVTNYLRTPQFADGIGVVRFWYRHGSTYTNDEPDNALSFALQKSIDNTNWTTLATVTNVLSTQYRQYTFYQYDLGAYFMRVLHTAGTNALLIDDMTVETPSAVPRLQDFNTWPSNTAAYGCYTNQEWIVCLGSVSSNLAKEGKSATLPGTNNYVRSPSLSNGYGTVSFSYRRGTNGSSAASLSLQSSTNGTTWTTLATVTNITSTSFADFSQFFYKTSPYYIRILNTSTGSGAGAATELINEPFNDGNTPPPGWIFNSISTYNTDTSAGDAPPSLQFNATGDYVITAPFNSPTGMTFWLKGQSADPASSFLIEGAVGGTWTTVATMTAISGSGQTYKYPLSTTVTNLRFTYTKVSGNVAFDDLKVFGAPGGAQPPQTLVLDSISIADPFLSRQQDFDLFAPASAYRTEELLGWTINDVIIELNNAYAGAAARVRDNANSYVQSPFFDDGVGPITFKYRHWDGTPAVTLWLQTSTNGTSWTTQDTLTFTNTDYLTYSKYLYITNRAAVRIINSSTADRFYLDDIDVGQLQPPADISLSGYIQPSAPYTGDSVYVWASAIPAYGAANIAVTSYYRIGTSGAFTAVSMTKQDFVNFRMNAPISPQPTGTIVQYYLRADFTGPASTSNSPKYYPAAGSNGPTFYGIPRAKPGSVWINEVNYYGYDGSDFDVDGSNQFIEIAGPAGFNLSNWRVQLVQGDNSTIQLGSYTATNGVALPNDSAGFGFWVIGGKNVATRDLLLTNNFFNYTYFAIRLINEVGGIEQSLSFGGVVTDATYVPKTDSFFAFISVALQGTGTTYGAFAWNAPTNPSPGAVNTGQSFGGTAATLPDLHFEWMTLNTNVALWVSGNTNNIGVAPYYLTNMLGSQAWSPVSPFNSSWSGGTNTFTFATPTSGTSRIYGILPTGP